jgi:YfiH family protein
MTTRVLTSSLLSSHGFSHGFSTRHGGVSAGAFASLNLGLSVEWAARASDRERNDEAARIEENTKLFLDACGLSARQAVRVRQVHGARTVDAIESLVSQCQVEADALISDRADLAIMVRTADCVPILLAHLDSGRVAAVHAGWRGLVAGVIEAAIAKLRSSSDAAKPQTIIAAIGPCIGVDSYEVGPEVASAFIEKGLGACVRGAGHSGVRPHLDCFAAAKLLLLRTGLSATQIDGEPLCTFRNDTEFFSARRDGAASGRLAAVIACRG